MADLVARLRAAGCVFAEDEAAVLRAAAPDAAALEAMTCRREAGEPLEQIVGWAEFDGLRIVVAPGVFVPRRRSLLLVDLAVAASPRVVVDLCCGAGAIAAAVIARRPGAEVHAADVDPAAVACARRNVPSVFAGDLFDALPSSLRGRVDVLVANAPYVPSDEVALMPREARQHEHLVALDGGADGLDVHRRILAGAAPWLAPGGRVLIETSARQVERDCELAAAAGFAVGVERSDDYDATALVASQP